MQTHAHLVKNIVFFVHPMNCWCHWHFWYFVLILIHVSILSCRRYGIHIQYICYWMLWIIKKMRSINEMWTFFGQPNNSETNSFETVRVQKMNISYISLSDILILAKSISLIHKYEWDRFVSLAIILHNWKQCGEKCC